MVGVNIFFIVLVNVVVDGVYWGVGKGLVGDATVTVPVAMSDVNIPPVNSMAGWLLYVKYLTRPCVYVGNCVLPEYILVNCTPTCSAITNSGTVSNIISDMLDTLGFTGTALVHLTFVRPCHSAGTFTASAVNVITQSPGDVSS